MIKYVAICAAGLGGLLVAAWFAIPQPLLPGFDEVRARWRPSDAQLLDRHGEPIHEVRIDRHGRRLAWVALDDISPALTRTVIFSEDRRFFTHHGVDFIAIAGSIRSRMAGSRGRGASTITMQLVALVEPALAPARRGRSGWQKLIQMKAALRLERRWSKREILEAYLNRVTWRGELQGVGAAARVMFGKQPHGINGGEAVVLAALLKAPNARRNPLTTRAQALRAAMAAEAPARAEVADALARAIALRGSDFNRVTLAPGLADRWLRVANGSTRCTLDRGLQRFAARTLRGQILEVRDRRVQDGALIVVENRTGEVWAYVAGTGDLSSAPYVDGVLAWRQPGSTLKPFLYALALDRRLLTPASLLLDTPLEVPEERGLYRPLDYDRQFRGMVSMRTALASSLNVPAVRAAELIGVEALAERLRRLGFAEIVEAGDYYGASLALGSADVSLWNLVNAYRTLANGGVLSPLRLFAGNSDPHPNPLRGQSLSKNTMMESNNSGGAPCLTLSHSLMGEGRVRARGSAARLFAIENACPPVTFALDSRSETLTLPSPLHRKGEGTNGGAAPCIARGKQFSTGSGQGEGSARSQAEKEHFTDHAAEPGTHGQLPSQEEGEGMQAGGPVYGARIYSAPAAYLISDILADRASRSATFGLENSLAARFWSAVKTGTSKDMRDNWCVGYTDRFTVGVWVGNFSGAPMRDVTGITGAAPVWLAVINYLHDRFGGDSVPRPTGLSARMIEFPHHVEPARLEWFIAGTEPNAATASLNDLNPRIVSPAAETIIARDPDIPRAQQRVKFEAGPGARDLRWRLDSRDLGPAARLILWPPAPGPHTLALVDRRGRALDQVSFKVRGTSQSTPPTH